MPGEAQGLFERNGCLRVSKPRPEKKAQHRKESFHKIVPEVDKELKSSYKIAARICKTRHIIKHFNGSAGTKKPLGLLRFPYKFNSDSFPQRLIIKSALKGKGDSNMTRLQAGDEAPDFEALTDQNQKLRLSDLRGQTVILYFYPQDDTPG
ncbi:MAG: redoxin domain-containing protein [candidate division KSB1 bacterium]